MRLNSIRIFSYKLLLNFSNYTKVILSKSCTFYKYTL